MSSAIHKAVARHWKRTKPRFTGHPRRFIYGPRPYKGKRKGMTKRSYFQTIEHDDPRYDAAPYEEGIVVMK